jgi:putative phosphoesterase
LRLALIADIHGNLLALEAVLADLHRQSIDAICNLGDHLSGPLWAAATADLLLAEEMIHIRGNHDRQLLDRPPEQMGASDQAAHAELSADHKAWLAGLPLTTTIGGILLCHGTPTRDDEYLLEKPDGSGLARPSLDGVRETVIACGHSHIPRVVTLADGRLIVNPGSVGLPAYNASDHDMECGSPHARYAILDASGDKLAVEHHAIEYNWNAAAARADERNRPDWAHALRTGYAAR